MYRIEVSRSLAPDVNHVAWDTKHGRERCKPAEHVTPPGILVVQVLNRGPLNQVEDEDALEQTR